MSVESKSQDERILPFNQRNDVLAEAVDSVMQVLSSLNRGDVLLHEDAEQASGMARYSEHWGQLIAKLKGRMLRERGIALVSLKEIGYKLATTREQNEDVPVNRMRRAAKQVARGINELSALPPQELTPDEQSKRVARLNAMQADRAMLNRDRRAWDLLTRKKRKPE